MKYVTVDTQSDPVATSFPSTEKQKDLAKILVAELLEMGVKDAHLDEWGYVYATIPSNSTKQNIPVICFCSHMDTSPDCSGLHVKPIIHPNYNGGDLMLPDDSNIVLKLNEHKDLKNQIGNDIITASGTTLLGADNKAGVAEIMDAAYQLMKHPEIKHGTIRILFTPDEEVGRGVEHVDMEKLAADFGYTMDGESRGNIEDETFSANAVKLTINGVSAHPGFAKGKMESALKITSQIIDKLPKDYLTPEATEAKEGFIHPVRMEGEIEKTVTHFIIRDFNSSNLEDHQNVLRKTVEEVLKNYPNASYQFDVIEQYRNMKEILDQFPHVVNNALEAIKRAGMNPKRTSIRGGTDGSRLSFMGLPCPNIFAGEHAFHSKYEWVSVQDMQLAVNTILHLCSIWEENA